MERRSRYIMYKRQRQRFAIFVYMLAIFFAFLTIIQWFLIWYFKEAHNFFRDNIYWSIGTFVTSLILISLFIFIEDLRFLTPLNWLIAMLIVEGVILGLASLVVRLDGTALLVQFFVWLTVVIVFVIVGTVMPHDLTLDVVVLFVMAVLAIIGAMFFLMLYLVTNTPYSFLVFRIFITASVLMFVMYHAQIINGSRFAEMRTIDLLLGGLILFHDFIILFLFTFFAAKKWSDLCNEHDTESYYGFKKQETIELGTTRNVEPKNF